MPTQLTSPPAVSPPAAPESPALIAAREALRAAAAAHERAREELLREYTNARRVGAAASR